MQPGRELHSQGKNSSRPKAAVSWDSTQPFQKSITAEVKPVNIQKKIANLEDIVLAPILYSFLALLNHLDRTKKRLKRQKLPGTLLGRAGSGGLSFFQLQHILGRNLQA